MKDAAVNQRPEHPEHVELLRQLQEHSFGYFVHEVNRANGLVLDKTEKGWPASIAAVGMALTCYPVGIERRFIERARRRRAHADHLALLRRQRAERRGRCDRLQGLLLPLPAHGQRQAGLEQRALEHRHRALHRRRAHGGGLFRRPVQRRGGDPRPRQDALRAHRMGLAAARRQHDLPWLAAGTGCRLHPAPMGRLRRGAGALHPGARLAHARHRQRELRRLVHELRVEDGLRHRVPVRRAPLHPPVVARLGRLPRHPGCLHAGQGQRLLREQPPRHAGPAAVRHAQPAGDRGCRRALLGHHRQRRAGADEGNHRRRRADVLRLRRQRRPRRPRRRHPGTLGRRCLAALRTRHRPADGDATFAA